MQECPICYDDKPACEFQKFFRCGHEYCAGCFTEMNKTWQALFFGVSCPTCRAEQKLMYCALELLPKALITDVPRPRTPQDDLIISTMCRQVSRLISEAVDSGTATAMFEMFRTLVFTQVMCLREGIHVHSIDVLKKDREVWGVLMHKMYEKAAESMVEYRAVLGKVRLIRQPVLLKRFLAQKPLGRREPPMLMWMEQIEHAFLLFLQVWHSDDEKDWKMYVPLHMAAFTSSAIEYADIARRAMEMVSGEAAAVGEKLNDVFAAYKASLCNVVALVNAVRELSATLLPEKRPMIVSFPVKADGDKHRFIMESVPSSRFTLHRVLLELPSSA
jgi:hypothetical protein